MSTPKGTRKYRMELPVFFALIILLGVFLIANPKVFLSPRAYAAVFTTAPLTAILATVAVFMVVSGEIDLSFPSIVGLGAYIFALVSTKWGNPSLAFLLALLTGWITGLFNGLLVAYIGLSSLVATLGMNFLIRGLIMMLTQGHGITLVSIKDSLLRKILVGTIGLFPLQVLWGAGLISLAWVIFNRHKFGMHVGFVGDNLQSARAMGIDVERVKLRVFGLMGLTSSFVGILSALLNLTFWPTTGDGYLLVVLAAVFVGGTPTWGGIGTIIGAVIGSLILSFIDTGIIASGLTGFYTQFFYGLILILALISHKFSGITRLK